MNSYARASGGLPGSACISLRAGAKVVVTQSNNLQTPEGSNEGTGVGVIPRKSEQHESTRDNRVPPSS